MNQSSVALPKRLLRIKRQAARLAELRCIRAAAQFEHAVHAQQVAQEIIDSADQSFRARCRELRLVEEVHASRHEIQNLETQLRLLLADVETARVEYDTAIKQRTTTDAEVEVLEKLLERRLEEIDRQAEQRKQQFADEWTMRRWNGADADRQETMR